MSQSARKNLSAVAVISIAVLALLFYWSLMVVVTFRVPHTGASARWHYPIGYQIVTVEPGSSAARAGLRPGDFVRYAKLVDRPCFPYTWLRCRPVFLFSGGQIDGAPPYALARPFALLVKRNLSSPWRHVTIDPGAGSRPYPVSDSFAIFLRLLAYTACVVLGAWLTLLRPGLMTWAFFATCLSVAAPTGEVNLVSMAILYFGPLSGDVFYINYSVQLGLAALPVFLLRFPNDTSPRWRRPVLIFTLCTVPWLLPLVFFVFPDQMQSGPALKVYIALFSFGILAAVYAQARGTDRQRLQWVTIGMACAIAASIINNFGGWRNASGGPYYHDLTYFVRDYVSTLLYAMMPICIFYAIIRHRVIDVRFIANRAIILGVLLLVLAIVFAGLDWIFTNFVSQSLWRIAIGMAAAFGVGWGTRSSVGALISWIDNVFFKKYHAAMTQLRELRFALEREAQVEDVQRILTSTIADVLRLGSAALFVSVPDGGLIRQASVGWTAGTPWHLFKDDSIAQLAGERRKPFSLQGVAWDSMVVPRGAAEPALAIPLVSRHRLVALALYGAHISGAEIDPDEVRLLKDLCAAAAPSFDQRTTEILAAPAFAADATRPAR